MILQAGHMTGMMRNFLRLHFGFFEKGQYDDQQRKWVEDAQASKAKEDENL